ncbi:hypothetical protein SCHPADRAFT_806520, partial [Schizopora paradoxa]
FASDRIQTILTKVSIGDDLTVDQRDRVISLIKEFADVFALNLAEVQYVDWHKHHLEVDPKVQLPRHRVHQQPVTGAQREWFFGILDEMEAASIIQKV